MYIFTHINTNSFKCLKLSIHKLLIDVIINKTYEVCPETLADYILIFTFKIKHIGCFI